MKSINLSFNGLSLKLFYFNSKILIVGAQNFIVFDIMFTFIFIFLYIMQFSEDLILILNY